MATEVMGPTVGDVIYWEEENRYSRDEITVASGQNLTLGAVLGKLTATGEYAEFDPVAGDGSEIASAILIADCDASSASALSVAIVREAIIAPDKLVWKTGLGDAEKQAALDNLKSLGIVPRTVS